MSNIASELLFYDRMALFLDLWCVTSIFLMPSPRSHLVYLRTSVVLGILYLAFQAFPIIFGEVHGFNLQSTGLAFLGIGLGMVLALLSQPIWNR